jgi:hypothetical protein
MDTLAAVLLRRTEKVRIVADGAAPADGPAWVAALEADLAARGWLLHQDLRAAAAALPFPVRVQWADWLLAAVEELAGADRTMLPLYRTFPDTPHDTEAVFVRRLLSHLFAEAGAPCVVCGSEQVGRPLDPCGHPVCPVCFPPEQFSACPICGRRLAAGSPYLPGLTEAGPSFTGPPFPGLAAAHGADRDGLSPVHGADRDGLSPVHGADRDGLSPAGGPSPAGDLGEGGGSAGAAGAGAGGSSPVAGDGSSGAENAVRLRLLRLETDPAAAERLRDELVARPGALGESDRDDLKVLVAATAPTSLDWLPETIASRETPALIIAWALHATALTAEYPHVLAAARRLWDTATDAARTLWAYSGGDPGLILPRPEQPGPHEDWRPAGEQPVVVPVARVRALPRPLRRAVLAHLDACGAGAAAEDLQRHPAVWKRLGERLHPHEQIAAHPGAAVAFAALRGTRTPANGPLGAAIVAACAREPRRLILVEALDGTVSVRVRTHAASVEEALESGDVVQAARLLTERPGDLWRRLDHLLRLAGNDPAGVPAVTTALSETAAHVAPGVLAAAAAELTGRDKTVAATPAQLAAVARARAAGLELSRATASRATGPWRPPFVVGPATPPERGLGQALRAAADRLGARFTTNRPADGPEPPSDQPSSAGNPLLSGNTSDRPAPDRFAVGQPPAAVGQPPAAVGQPPAAGAAAERPGDDGRQTKAGIVGGRPGPGMPRRVFFPRGSTVTTWTEPERRPPLPATAIATVRELADAELTRRAARLGRFEVAVVDAGLALVPAPMRERAASASLAGWPRGSVRILPEAEVLRLFLHWEDTEAERVDLDLSCVFFDTNWKRVGHCDYTALRFGEGAAIHSGDLTSAPAPEGATEFLDLNLPRLVSHRVRYLVPSILSYNAVPFEALTEAFAGLMLPVAGGGQFDAARVEQRFDLRGDARMLMPMVVDLRAETLLWTDLALSGRGYGHSVGRHGDQLARAASDQIEHFAGGTRATLLDLLAWQAAGRAERVLVAHRDGTYSEVRPEVAAIRAAADAGTGPVEKLNGLDGLTVLAGVVDGERLALGAVAPGSVALTVTGTPPEPWTAVRAGDVLGQLSPAT